MTTLTTTARCYECAWTETGPDADKAAEQHMKRTGHHSTGSKSVPEGVGTGAGGGDDRAIAEATSWVNRSADCPEDPAQAHLRTPIHADAASAPVREGQK